MFNVDIERVDPLAPQATDSNSFGRPVDIGTVARYLQVALLGLFLGSYLTSAAAATLSDIEKEQRWADQVEDGLLDGESLLLDNGKGHEFYAIYTEAEESTQRAAIVVHGIGVHPDWPDVIYPLRTELPLNGWSTLSIQMPILANGVEATEYVPLMPEVAPRIDAAIAYLQSLKYQSVVIVAHSMGATMSTQYLASAPTTSVARFVAVGMPAQVAGNAIDNTQALGQIALPILDLFGSEDLPQVIASKTDRQQAARSGGNAHYAQVEVAGAEHFFQGYEETLVETVVNWLDKP